MTCISPTRTDRFTHPDRTRLLPDRGGTPALHRRQRRARTGWKFNLADVTALRPLIAAARHFGWDYGVLEAAASACNDKGEVAIITAVVPKLFLVLATKAKGKSSF